MFYQANIWLLCADAFKTCASNLFGATQWLVSNKIAHRMEGPIIKCLLLIFASAFSCKDALHTRKSATRRLDPAAKMAIKLAMVSIFQKDKASLQTNCINDIVTTDVVISHYIDTGGREIDLSTSSFLSHFFKSGDQADFPSCNGLLFNADGN